MKKDTPTLTPTLTASQVVQRLYAELGTLRSWADFLSDNIRGRQSLNGLTLMPVIRMKDVRTYRPRYAVNDVDEFVNSVLAKVPGAGSTKIVPKVLAIEKGRHWRLNKFDQEGVAIKLSAVRFAKTQHAHHAH